MTIKAIQKLIGLIAIVLGLCVLTIDGNVIAAMVPIVLGTYALFTKKIVIDETIFIEE